MFQAAALALALARGLGTGPKPEPRTHDYTLRHRGHDYAIRTFIDGGKRLKVSGWGRGLGDGDYLLMENQGGTTRYRIEAIRYYPDPPDMWAADVVFAPRDASLPAVGSFHG